MRAEFDNAGTPSSVEAEIAPPARSRIRVNRKAVSSRRDLGAAAPCTIFSPDDLTIISGGPKGRRDLLDDALALLDAEGARAADDTERILRQRAALLRQSGGRASAEVDGHPRRVGPTPGRCRQGPGRRRGSAWWPT